MRAIKQKVGLALLVVGMAASVVGVMALERRARRAARGAGEPVSGAMRQEKAVPAANDMGPAQNPEKMTRVAAGERESVGSDGQAWSGLLSEAESCLRRRDYVAAIPVLQRVLAENPDASKALQVRLVLLDALLATQQFAEAREMIAAWLPEVADRGVRLRLDIKLAGIMRAEGDLAGAEAHMRQVLSAAEPAEQGMISKSLLAFWHSQPQRMLEAQQELEAAHAAGTATAAELQLLGNLYYQLRQDPVRAAAVYEEVWRANPTDPAITQILASLYEKSSRPLEAIALHRSLLAGAGKNIGEIHYKIATLLLAAGRGGEASAYARTHLTGAAASSTDLRQAARLFRRTADYVEAAAALARAAELSEHPQRRLKIRFERAELLAEYQDRKQAAMEVRTLLQEPDLPADAAAWGRQLLERWGEEAE